MILRNQTIDKIEAKTYVKQSETVSHKTYNDSVHAGSPSPTQNRGYIRNVALLAVVDPFEHAICFAKCGIQNLSAKERGSLKNGDEICLMKCLTDL